MPIVRKKVKCDFTTVHNAFLRDNKLGATARGVLLTMISMPENWKFSIKGLNAPVEIRIATMAEFHKSGSFEPFYGIARPLPRESTARRFIQ